MRTTLVIVGLLCILAEGKAEIRIQADFSPEEHSIFGTQWVNSEDLSKEAWFVLLANLGREENPFLGLAKDSVYVSGFDPSWTEIEAVVWVGPQGEEGLPWELHPAPSTLQAYSREDVFLHVLLPGGEGELRIDFRTRFPELWAGEPGRLGDVYTWRLGWHPLPVSPPTVGYWPFLIPAHSYRVELRLPPGWTAALPGEVKRERTTFQATFDRPVRSMPLFIAPREELQRAHLPLEGLTVDVWAFPPDEDGMRALGTMAWEITRFYEQHFGPYPHERLLLVEHPNDLGIAMAAPGVVFLPRFLLRRMDLTAPGVLSRYAQYVLAHELAHQWWGVGIGVDLDAENWLSEGLAQYMAIRWFEEVYGEDGGLFRSAGQGLGEGMVDTLLGYVNLREHMTELPYLETARLGFDEAVVKPTAACRYLQENTVRLYDKGYLVLRALAHLVGEEEFDQFLSHVHAQFQGKTLSVQDFRSLLEGQCGLDLTEFFESWVLGDAQADYGVDGFTTRKTEDGYVTEVHLWREGSGFLPVEVEVRGPQGEREVSPPSEASTLCFETAWPVQEVVVDPGHYVLDIDRLNNIWPRRYVVAVGRNELPLDAYLIQADPLSGALLLSYLDWYGWGIQPQARALSMWVRYGRVGQLSGFAQVQDTLIGELTFTRYLWSQPPTGMAGTYWAKAGDLSLSLARRPYLTLGLDLSWQGTVGRAHFGGLSLLCLPKNGGRVDLRHTERLPLMPHTYLDIALSISLGSPSLPWELAPALTELHFLAERDTPPSGERKAFFSLGGWLPPQGGYNIGGLALVSELRPRLYVSVGRVWALGSQATKDPIYAEWGGELWVQLWALGGTMAIQGVVGVAWPLLEGAGALRAGILYWGVGL